MPSHGGTAAPRPRAPKARPGGTCCEAQGKINSVSMNGHEGPGLHKRGPSPGAPRRPRLGRWVTSGPGSGQGRQQQGRQVYSLSLRVRPLVFSTNSKGYFGLCMMPISATGIQSMCTPKDGPFLCLTPTDGVQYAKSGLAMLHRKETGRLYAKRSPQAHRGRTTQNKRSEGCIRFLSDTLAPDDLQAVTASPQRPARPSALTSSARHTYRESP